MKKRPGSFGFGGSGKLGGHRPDQDYARRRNFLLLLMLFLVVLVAVFIFSRGMSLYNLYLEQDVPQVQVSGEPKGLGKDPVSIKVIASDKGSGIADVFVTVDQVGERHEAAHRHFEGRKDFDTLTFELSASQLRLIPGDAVVNVEVVDHSYFKNKQQSSFTVRVDYESPKVFPLTTEHNINLGGADLIFYQVDDANGVFSGVKAGNTVYQGFPAKNLDPYFGSFPNIYFAFYPLPLTWKKEEGLQLFAQDIAGNIGTSDFRFQVKPYKGTAGKIQMTDQFLESSVSSLFNAYKKVDPDFKGWPVRDFSTSISPEEWIDRFAVVNVRYRDWTDKQVRALLGKEPQAVKYWDTPFIRMVGAATESGFGARRTYVIAGREAGQSIHYGVDLASIKQAAVMAANDGVVLYAGDLGIYGNAVIIDHGFGISSLYGHLSSISVAQGSPVKAGQEIARSGTTGLAGGDHLHFEIRVHGEPVHPREWWDRKWISEHVDKQLSTLKAELAKSHPEATAAAEAAEAARIRGQEKSRISDNRNDSGEDDGDEDLGDGGDDENISGTDKSKKLLDEARKLLEE